MDAVGSEAVGGLGMLIGMADGDDSEGYDLFGEREEVFHSFGPLFDGMKAHPDCAETQMFGFEEQILSSCGAVLHPEAFVALAGGIAADDDGEVSGIQRGGEALKGADFFKNTAVFDDNELPRLLVAGRGRVHGGAQQLFKVFGADRLIGETADAPAGKDFFHGEFAPFF